MLPGITHWEREEPLGLETTLILPCMLAPCLPAGAGAGPRRQHRYSSGCGSAPTVLAAPQLRCTAVNLPVAHTAPLAAIHTWRLKGSRKTSCFLGLLGSGSRKALLGVGRWDIKQAPTQSSGFNFPDLLVQASCTFRDGVLSSISVKGEYPLFHLCWLAARAEPIARKGQALGWWQGTALGTELQRHYCSFKTWSQNMLLDTVGI